ncbi:MAG: sodium:calcium symporter [Deltaproteobacteria bacterium RIFCSPLOWO2_02_FULL_53_8]|nr:MAG: sodium:calcium symporter [Deltaproteobacteria bacterium RIFCSPLOWO2_02_FULL_53_8]
MPDNHNGRREQWGSRWGLILAMAGNAIGLGNFLRFPVQAAQNGGGAFMIPYFVSFILLGLPLMWIEWGVGRYGGSLGHGTSPAIFDALWKSRVAKYVGILGVFLPLVVLVYYIYVCSWTLAFSVFSALGSYPVVEAGSGAVSTASYLAPYRAYLNDYIGASSGGAFFTPLPIAYFFFIVTLVMGMAILGKGVAKGIEVLNKIAIPALFVMAAVLFIRVLSMNSPVDSNVTAATGLAFLWEPDMSGLLNPKVWLSAAGQVFFTLSLGMGAIITYASYVKHSDDIALAGLAAASFNEFAEVVFGSTIALVSAVIFFGPQGASVIAGDGAFSLGFISMPAIFTHIGYGGFYGFIWFLLLFFAGITSVVALAQPAIAFFEDELGWTRRRSVITLAIFFFIAAHLPMLVTGALDELDFWAATLGLVILALFEVIIFFWIFGAEKAWEEIACGGRIRIPRVFFYIMKYVTPLFLFVILVAWGYDQLPGVLSKSGVGVWLGRAFLLALLGAHIYAVKVAWKRRRNRRVTEDMQ